MTFGQDKVYEEIMDIVEQAQSITTSDLQGAIQALVIKYIK